MKRGAIKSLDKIIWMVGQKWEDSLHGNPAEFHHNSQFRLPTHYHLKWTIHKLKIPTKEKTSLNRILFCLLAIRTLLETGSFLNYYKLHKKNQVIRIKFTNFFKSASRF